MLIRPLAIDLYCGLGGWTSGLMAEGYDVIGFDIERHVYGEHKYPAQLVIQDVLTLHGSQFRNVDLIVASPPCQEYSYMAMPWSRAKKIAQEYRSGVRNVKKLTALFDACFRLQREACQASGRHIPLIVENVRGAIPWVGRSRWNFGSFHLWGDVPALMPMGRQIKVRSFRFDGSGRSLKTASVEESGIKAPGMNWSDQTKRGQDFTRIAGQHAARMQNIPADIRPTSLAWGNESRWFNDGPRSPDSISSSSSSSPRRKAASAMIAKIPEPLSRHIAATFKPVAACG